MLTLDTELARAAALAEREHDVAGAMLPFGGCDDEDSVIAFLHVLDLFVLEAFEIGAFENLFPEGNQIFLGEFRFLEFSVHREFDGAGHHQLLTGIFRDSSPNFALVEGDVIEFFLDGTQGGADPRGTGADDHHVTDIGNGAWTAPRCGSPGDDINALAALV